MKSIIIILAIALLSVTAYAEEQMYEVTIEIKYNAITQAEADKVIADAIERHQAPCKIEITKSKAGSGLTNISVDHDFKYTDTVAK